MMKYTKIYFLLLFGLLMSCCGARVENNEQKQTSKFIQKKPEHQSGNHSKEMKDIEDSIYPKEYTHANYHNFYKKVMKGVYVFADSPDDDPGNAELLRLDFFDEKGNKINEFDIKAHNPYTKDRIPTIKRDNYGGYVYRSYIALSESEKHGLKATEHYTYSQMPSSEGNPVIGYHVLGSVEGKGVVDWKFTAACMDEKGNVLREFKDLDIDAREFCMSENKEFFCVSYGGLRGENLTRLINDGFRIYEIETGEIVYEVNVDNRHTISGPYPDNSLSNFPYGGIGIKGNDFSNDRSKEYINFDFNSRKIYRKKLSYETMKSISGADKEGFLMKDKKTGKKWKLYYDKDFRLEKF